MRKQILNCAQPVFRDQRDTDLGRYKSKTEEEPRHVKNILRKLMMLRTKTPDTRRISNASLEPDQFYEREDQYLSNVRTGREHGVICPGMQVGSTGSIGNSPCGTTHRSNKRPVATSAVQERRHTSKSENSSRVELRFTGSIKLEFNMEEEIQDMEIPKMRRGRS